MVTKNIFKMFAIKWTRHAKSPIETIFNDLQVEISRPSILGLTRRVLDLP